MKTDSATHYIQHSPKNYTPFCLSHVNISRNIRIIASLQCTMISGLVSWGVAGLPTPTDTSGELVRERGGG